VTSGFFLSQAKRSTLATEQGKGRSFFKLSFEGAPDVIAHVDDKGNVTIWDNQKPITTSMTREQAEASGMEFKTATEDAITRHCGAENSKTYRAAKLWQRKIVVPIVVVFAVLTISLVFYGSRRIVRNLPPTENPKLAGMASITNYGRFVWNAYNGSEFVLTEVKVSISVFDEKGNAIISNRVYRVPAYDFYPQQTKELSTDVGFTLGQDQKWAWLVVGARGRPE